MTKTWWTNADGTADADGLYQTRGFYGDYEITATTKDGRTRTRAATLAPDHGAVELALP